MDTTQRKRIILVENNRVGQRQLGIDSLTVLLVASRYFHFISNLNLFCRYRFHTNIIESLLLGIFHVRHQTFKERIEHSVHVGCVQG